ncbi:PTS lactose/cellobiose transporter subunit IIA [Companilactobacillus kimchii]|uniref:Cellobiose-specific PTS system IIA component n=2 Tax=Companilactobacillus kimchii TaxID=2801452 RepID=A0ABR5NVI1_9LACO|nr:PTS lactose/cellobiose transporter subunit IIA [Companilactobacillus kimchii]KAE9558080.1 PTS lactose transporter subunit IIA [Companilactobacillus kimchii]KRK52886.1 cellobiose-specific PTS system IIA component [Companilactobacillus kimchii DSM 13961 = JCM 10707]OWF33014.1 Protein-N(pi)-phosphohistidine--sugar phosphotransferase [Companilactobacillus kimchii]GEO46975.1 PTS lactose transporter subunit IIA [Companilactobacillus paralimentarius]
MSEEEFDNKSVKDTMDIIINAGDARAFIAEALDDVGDFNYEEAKENIKKADAKLVVAHRLQTKKLQEEAEGDKVQYSVLFTHAQDTLMTIMSEYNLAKHLIAVFEKRDQKSK